MFFDTNVYKRIQICLGLMVCLVLYQPLDHTPCAINHVKQKVTNIKWFIVALWPISSCALTFNSVC